MATDRWRDIYEILKHSSESALTGDQEAMLLKCKKSELIEGIIEYCQASYRIAFDKQLKHG